MAPVYLYRCADGHEFEISHSLNDDLNGHICETECGNNGNEICKEEIQRIPCTTAFNLLGSGWPGKRIKEGN